MNNIYNSLIITLIFLIDTFAQVPVQFYDFEINSDRTQGEVTTEIIINPSAGSTVISQGGVLSNTTGNPSSGSAIVRDDWDENLFIDPGVNAVDYIEFSCNTEGFGGIFIKVDAKASISLQPFGELNLLYSADGGNSFNSSSSAELDATFNTYVWNLSGETALDNNPNVVFRLYAFGNLTPQGNGSMTMDNLYISAERIASSRTLGDYNLIDNANGVSSFPVFNNFTVDGAGILVELQSDLRLNGILSLNDGLIVTNNYKVIMDEGSQINNAGSQSYIANCLTIKMIIDDDPSGRGTEENFPVGSLAGFHPVTIAVEEDDNTDGGDIVEVTITQIDEEPFPATLPSAVDRISYVRYWRLESTESLDNINLTLTWAADDSVHDPDNLTIVYGNANGPWTDESNNGGFFGTQFSGNITGSFDGENGDYTFGNLNGGGNPLPVELSTFDIRIVKNNAHLSWSTDTEINSYKFEIQRMSSEDMNWKTAGEVMASGNSNSPKYYSFADRNLKTDFYSYRLKMIDNDGTFEYSNEIHTEINITNEYELSQNFPNPFNPVTVITYKLPDKSHVLLQIFNVLGNEIATIVDEEKPAGTHRVEIDISEIAPELSNGTYFYRLKAGNYTEAKKMIYMK